MAIAPDPRIFDDKAQIDRKRLNDLLIQIIAALNGSTGGLPAIANNTLLANISGALAVPSATTLSAALDAILGSTQGQIITRNAANWTVLGPGATGTYLKGNGVGANLSYGPAALQFFTEALASTGTNISVNVSSLSATAGLGADQAIAFVWRGNGYISAQIPDGAATGGNVRGPGSLDMQTSRTAAANAATGVRTALIATIDSKVATGANSAAIAADRANVTGSQSLSTGSRNTADNDNCFVMGHFASSRGVPNLFVRGFGGNALAEMQTMYFPLMGDISSSVTPKSLTVERGAVNAASIPVLANNSMGTYWVRVWMKMGTNRLSATITGAILRDANIASTVLLGAPTITYLGRTAGVATVSWTVNAVAEATSVGGLLIQCTDGSAGGVVNCGADCEFSLCTV